MAKNKSKNTLHKKHNQVMFYNTNGESNVITLQDTSKSEWLYDYSILNPKYQIQDVDAYDFLMNNTKRVIQLSTIAKLTTDNMSVISDFPIDYDTMGMEPYDEYTIKICDTYGTELYIFVHRHDRMVYLLPVVMGFDSNITCAPVNLTDNGRIRNMSASIHDIDGLVAFLSGKSHPSNVHLASGISSEHEFGIYGRMLAIDVSNGVYENLSVFSNFGNGLLRDWQKSEQEVMHNRGLFIATCPSSTALCLQIWLHTICMWRKRCLMRQVKVVHSSGQIECANDIKEYVGKSKQVIIDINKDIIAYVNDGLSKREFRGYHMRESLRCGHFRHLSGERIVYIPPTVVHYKKVLPQAGHLDCRPIVYRNTEDFLREKSYLENDILFMLRGHGLRYEREKRFDWMGLKRLDFYLDDKRIAIECQGVQHFYPYGSKDKDFKARQQRDIAKYAECQRHGISIIYYVNKDIPIPKDMSNVYTYVSDLDVLYKLISDVEK